MGRMRQEATLLGAHGVIGVRLTSRAYEWGPDLLEFTAVGTAVRLRGAPAPQTPFLSDLSGEDFWTLVQAGYLPAGLAMGFCAYLVYGSRGMYSFGNQELTDFTAGVYQARALAMTRLHEDLARLGAAGVVGVKVETNRRFVEGGDNQLPRLHIDFLALGTAIVPSEHGGRQVAPGPVLNMTGLRPVRPRLEAAELQSQ